MFGLHEMNAKISFKHNSFLSENCENILRDDHRRVPKKYEKRDI